VSRAGIAFQTERLVLRKWKPQDIEELTSINADPDVMEFFPSLMTRSETLAMSDRIQAHFKKYGYGLWAVEILGSSQFIGFVGLSVPTFQADFTPCVEVGWRLAKEHWGKGYATEAARACLSFAFSSLGLQEVVSFTAALNRRSENVMKRLGMRRAGEFAHPRLPSSHRLCNHVLYRITQAEFLEKGTI